MDELKKIIENSNNIIIVGTPTWSQDVDSVIGNKVNDNVIFLSYIPPIQTINSKRTKNI